MRTSSAMITAVLASAFLAISGCGRDVSPPAGTSKEAIPSRATADFFGASSGLSTELAALPPSARLANRGWPAYYWPSARWGLLWRYFDATLSPIEKFEAAFGAELQAANPGYQPGDLAALERRRVRGVTATWFGICDGSAEASLAFDEPRTVKLAGGQAFAPFEVKALLAYFVAMSSFDRVERFAGFRVDAPVNSVDADGRPVDWRVRDVNPGLFHLALTNYLGLRGRGMVADIIAGAVVLNYPVKGYRVLSSSPVTDPARLARYKTFDAAAVRFVEVRTEVEYGESHRYLEPLPGNVDPAFGLVYDYVLELDADGRIIGGEWLGASRTNHPDFLWLPAAPAVLGTLTTGRLAQKLHVGPALNALFAAPDASDSAARIAKLAKHADNAEGYALFAGDAAPPTTAEVEAALGVLKREASTPF